MDRELDFRELQIKGISKPLFTTTAELEGLASFSQERAQSAIELGLSVKAYGYNVFAAGEAGTGRTNTCYALASQIMKSMPSPPDYAYIHNFDGESREPKLLKLPTGLGSQLAEDIESLLADTREDLSQALGGQRFEDEKIAIVRHYQERRDTLVEEVTLEAQRVGFGSKTTNTGIYFMPLFEGEPITDEAYEDLSEDEKKEIERTSAALSLSTAETLKTLRDYEAKVRKEVSGLEYSTAMFTLGSLFAPIFKKYSMHNDVLVHLCSVREDILANLESFIKRDAEEEEEALASVLPWYQRRGTEGLVDKYKINLVADNSKARAVIIDYNPTPARLVGELEYEAEYGNLTTDFAKIRPGLLHQANGGCLILRATDVLQGSWDVLRRALLKGELVPEPINTSTPVYGLRPEPIPLDVKIILIGTPELYNIACEYLEDFSNLFKIYAEFDYETPLHEASFISTARLVAKGADKEEHLHMDYGAVCELCMYLARIVESATKLSTSALKLGEVHTEASLIAKAAGASLIEANHVQKAVDQQEKRHNLYETKLSEMLERRIIMIDTDGAKVGQVNALAVLEAGGHVFGKPSRITATTYVGKSGIINIEKEVELSGPVHDKGVLVLAGYLGQTYAQDFALSLSARIAFEQTYQGVDGDSASLAELLALISSLSNLPLRQDIAVTGSLNQRGEVQAVGGVIYKIEGFFELCKQRGLTSSQGVAIPSANIGDLVLKHEVVEAVRCGKFHIYPLDNVDSALGLMLNKPAGILDEATGRYPIDTVHSLVYRRLRKFAKRDS